MSRKIAKPENRLGPGNGPEPTIREQPVDWKLAFVVLASCTCTGFVTSREVERIVERLKAEGLHQAAEVVIKIFNGTHSERVHSLMG